MGDRGATAMVAKVMLKNGYEKGKDWVSPYKGLLNHCQPLGGMDAPDWDMMRML